MDNQQIKRPAAENKKPLNNYHPHLTERIILEVSDEIVVTFSGGGCLCDSYKCRKRERGECPPDNTPGFEADVTQTPLIPEEIRVQTWNKTLRYGSFSWPLEGI